MKIRVLFFGATAKIVSERELGLVVEAGTTCGHLIEHITKQFSGLRSHKLHISLNQQYATGNEIVRDGDEIAIFTAVSGG